MCTINIYVYFFFESNFQAVSIICTSDIKIGGKRKSAWTLKSKSFHEANDLYCFNRNQNHFHEQRPIRSAHKYKSLYRVFVIEMNMKCHKKIMCRKFIINNTFMRFREKCFISEDNKYFNNRDTVQIEKIFELTDRKWTAFIVFIENNLSFIKLTLDFRRVIIVNIV